MFIGQVVGIISILLMDYLQDPVTKSMRASCWYMVGMMCFSFCVALFIKPDYKRTRSEKFEKNKEISRSASSASVLIPISPSRTPLLLNNQHERTNRSDNVKARGYLFRKGNLDASKLSLLGQVGNFEYIFFFIAGDAAAAAAVVIIAAAAAAGTCNFHRVYFIFFFSESTVGFALSL